MSTWQRLLARMLFSAAAIYALLIALLWWQQERLLFLPTRLPAEHRFVLGPDVHERWVDVPGARLNVLHLRNPKADGAVFFLHGNGGSLDSWFVNPEFYRALNLDLVMLDYRGYGKSSGRIESEAQLHADVRAAWDATMAEYTGRRRIVYGRSLGSGLAAKLAADVQPELTVLVSPYESMRALAAEHYPWVPGAVLRYPLDTAAALPRIRGPVVLLHGDADRVIGVQHSQRLKALRPDAALVVVPGAAHNDLQTFPGYLDPLRNHLASQSSASK